MKNPSGVRELARLLYQSEGALDLYELHDRYQLGPAEILRLVRLFRRMGLIVELNAGMIALREGGREEIWKRRYSLLFDGNRPWAKVGQDRMNPGEPYLPDLSKVDRVFFYAKVATT